MTLADRIIAYNRSLEFTGLLPPGIRIMNPFRNNPHAIRISQNFYTKYYNDNKPRFLILGINPGRFGAGATGIPFTDTIRLNEKCGIPVDSFRTYEASSAFIYEMIDAFGSVKAFYEKFFVSAVCPLGFTRTNDKGTAVNYNYYDSKELTQAVYNFITENLEKQLRLGIDTTLCYCLGTGKNEDFLRKLNERQRFFKTIIALEHPRFIMQYKVKSKKLYIEKYLSAFNFPGKN